MAEDVMVWGVVTSAIGMGYFLYGKRQQSLVPWICGLMLMIVPYVITSLTLLLGISLVLAATPYFVKT